MNPKRWIYVGVLALSAIAFVVDRAFLAEPETAAAAEALPSAKKDGAMGDAPPGPQEPSGEIDPTLARLEQLPETTPGRDVFALSGVFLPARGGFRKRPKGLPKPNRPKRSIRQRPSPPGTPCRPP